MYLFRGYFSDCGGMQNSLPPLGLWDVSFEAKDRKREGPVPSYIGARLLTSVISLLPFVGVEFFQCHVGSGGLFAIMNIMWVWDLYPVQVASLLYVFDVNSLATELG